jgi:hypothetical protein
MLNQISIDMTETQLFIRLKTTSPLPKGEAIAWYHCVKNNAPSGILGSVQTTNPEGKPDVVFMVHKETNGGTHYYEVPLTRDLTEKEADAIKEAYLGSEGIIETSSNEVKAPRHSPADAVVMEEDDYNNLCETLAKHQHQRWYDQRSKNGWSFGLEIDSINKTHPLMRPWEQLPDQYKNIDYELPHLLMDLLVNSGYVVVRSDDLNKWLRKK